MQIKKLIIFYHNPLGVVCDFFRKVWFFRRSYYTEKKIVNLKVKKFLRDLKNHNFKSESRKFVLSFNKDLFSGEIYGGELSTIELGNRLVEAGHFVIGFSPTQSGEMLESGEPFGCKFTVFTVPIAQYHSVVQRVIRRLDRSITVLYGAIALDFFGLGRNLNGDFIVTVKGWPEVANCSQENIEHVKLRFHNRTLAHRKMYSKALSIVSNSCHTARVVKKFYGCSSSVIYMPIQLNNKVSVIGKKQRRDMLAKKILLVNSSKGKGGWLIRELAVLNPDKSFYVVSGVKRNDWPSNVFYRSYYRGSYADMYQGHDMVLFPTIGGDVCGTSRVPVEAMSLNIPVISSSTGGVPEIVPNDWLIFDSSDIAEWNSKINSPLSYSRIEQLCGEAMINYKARSNQNLWLEVFGEIE